MENQRLVEAVGALEHSLNAPVMGREYAWSERMGWALSTVERSLLRLIPTAEDQDSGSDEYSFPRPGAGKAGKDLPAILQKCRELRRAVQELAQPFTTPTEVDLSPILREGRELLASLRLQYEIEADLLWNHVGARN